MYGHKVQNSGSTTYSYYFYICSLTRYKSCCRFST